MLSGGVLLGLAALAAATPFWQAQHTNLLPSSMARNIRHLPCVSRRSGESGTCMFAFSCAKLNGTHLGTCIDRFYFGSCCKVPEDTGNDLDVVPPIEDNSLDGTTTARIRPAVTQKPPSTPQHTTPAYSTPRPSTQGLLVQSTPGPSTSSTQLSTAQGVSGSTQTFGSTSGFPSSTPSFGSSTSGFSGSPPGFGSSTPSFGSGSPGFGSSTPSFGSSTPSFGSSKPSSGSSSTSFESSPPSFGSSPQSSGSSSPSFGSSTPSFGSSTPGFSGSTQGFGSSQSFGSSTPTTPVSTQGPVSSTSGLSSSTPGGASSATPGFSSSTPGSISSTQTVGSTSGVPNKSPVSSSTPTLPSFQQPTTAPPTFVTWTTIEEATGKPPPISIRPQVSEVSGGTHRPTLVSSTERPSTERPVITSTVVLPISPVSSPRPPVSTHKPTVTAKPSNGTKPASTVKPVTSKPTGGTAKPGSTASKPVKPTKPAAKPTTKPPGTPRPQVTSPKPQKPPPKPAVTKPKPPPKPAKPPTKPTSPRPPPKPATTRPTTTSTTTTQASSSETWVPISVSTHEPSTTPPTTDRPAVSSSSQSPAPSSTPGPSSSSVALPSVMSTTPAPVDTQGLNMSNYKDVCGRRLFPESRVVGGDKSTFGKWPWQISLRQWRTSTYLHKCGAALLNENWAITAAHCVENVPPSDLLLRLGEHDLSIEDEPFGYQERRVQIVASHPQFDPRTFEYDLALLRFYEPVVFQPNIIPICVPEDDTHFVGTTAYVTGWGRLYEDGPLPSVLQEVSVPVINNTLCETMYRAAGYIEHIPDIFICAGWKKGGFDSCEGDSGGPMVIQRPDKRWLLAGVISWGIGCAEPNQPGVYTRISQFRHWINQILQF